MIDVHNTAQGAIRLVVRGNQSMSWRANLWLAASLGVVCLGIALVMASHGFWMILPFAGAEILFIVFCLHLTLKRLSHQEVITVDGAAIRLEWGYTRPNKVVNLPRQWSRLRYACSDNPFEVGDLSLGAHGKRYALGRSLGRAEKKVLYSELKAVL